MANPQGQSRSAKYFRENPEARRKKQEYNRKYKKRPEQVKKRVEAIKANRKAGTYGNGDGIDYSHPRAGKKNASWEKQSANRGDKKEKKAIAKRNKGAKMKLKNGRKKTNRGRNARPKHKKE
ncbi:MAG: hypothetical protein R3345_06265 [Fulvivirga sp.]|nr:hypothetical protein [Fulvivirga sp.]